MGGRQKPGEAAWHRPPIRGWVTPRTERGAGVRHSPRPFIQLQERDLRAEDGGLRWWTLGPGRLAHWEQWLRPRVPPLAPRLSQSSAVLSCPLDALAPVTSPKTRHGGSCPWLMSISSGAGGS